jgi:hypothetical protein
MLRYCHLKKEAYCQIDNRRQEQLRHTPTMSWFHCPGGRASTGLNFRRPGFLARILFPTG